MQKQKIFKFQTINVLLGIFGLKIGKNDCDIWNQSPPLDFAEMQKLVQNKLKKQIWDLKCLIWVFGVVTLKKYCHIFSILKFVKLQSFVQN